MNLNTYLFDFKYPILFQNCLKGDVFVVQVVPTLTFNAFPSTANLLWWHSTCRKLLKCSKQSVLHSTLLWRHAAFFHNGRHWALRGGGWRDRVGSHCWSRWNRHFNTHTLAYRWNISLIAAHLGVTHRWITLVTPTTTWISCWLEYPDSWFFRLVMHQVSHFNALVSCELTLPSGEQLGRSPAVSMTQQLRINLPDQGIWGSKHRLC